MPLEIGTVYQTSASRIIYNSQKGNVCIKGNIHVWNEAEIDLIQCNHGCTDSTGLRLLNYILYSERENSLIRLYKHVRIYIYIYK